MTDVMVVLKVFPEGDETDLEKVANELVSKLPEGYKLVRKETEPIAFGLKALVVYVSMPEKTEGGTDTLEELASSIEGVSHAEVVGITRLGF
ncbi:MULTISPECIES: elongation factor 1-beta [Metallosphaera]|uniref:Elongation factor 1-beta n=3 Tax=Metallosphaera TaxID=41980 RepID=EF1B_METS5|nr:MULTISPECIES: elongation factor 1-beta [Metallosphaera]A4YD84.1 RecName: Full=Elongation factor 1-beta; Short=EF-1-beta; AltName: Full=aEF-1beta [Metallosphaera sedula DSM 5348]ABP94386.1 translation elongation factor 1B (aEF-1B) [Metallosphaera sedula DSM 5348]AIM26373.1 translation elongation factor 1B (aEF-1B) [Metallosphaera sedula]AKV73379.1 elongation factor 1-beta [Metallosphaera sedula]AKV75623.1 elongation factor 1-beta [Metallosphaera sedula]AKV77869.1 elongation factor 1-beta [M